jgi:hypothetical protein
MSFPQMSIKIMQQDLSVTTRRVISENLANYTLLKCENTPI